MTELLRDFGVVLGTSATGGTGEDEGTEGTIEWLEDHAPGKFVVAASYAHEFYSPSLEEMGLAANLGAFVHTSIGWYENTGPSQWKLDGGHRVTMVGATGLCGGPPSGRRLKFRDPGSGGDSLITQSAFATTDVQATAAYGYFGGDNGNGFTVYFNRTQELLHGYGDPGFVKGYRAVFPGFGVTLQPPAQPGFGFHYPIQPTDHPHPPPTVNVPLGAGASAPSVALAPDLLSMYYVVTNASGAPDPRVFQIDRSTGASTVFHTGAAPRCVETGRFKVVYIIDGMTLIAIDPTEPAPRGSGSAPTPHPVDALAYDDTTDRLFGAAGASGKIILWVRDVMQPPQVLNLPPSVVLNGTPYLAVSPLDGSIWLRSLNSPNIYKMTINAGGGLTVADIVNSSLFVGAAGLDVDHTQTREHILLARAGGVLVFEKTPTGWQRNTTSDFAGLPANGLIRLARSRSNFDPWLMSGDDQRDVPPDFVSAESLDCPGDLNGDGAVNSGDVALLLGAWGPDADGSAADINRDGIVNAGDLAQLLGAWGPCA